MELRGLVKSWKLEVGVVIPARYMKLADHRRLGDRAVVQVLG